VRVLSLIADPSPHHSPALLSQVGVLCAVQLAVVPEFIRLQFQVYVSGFVVTALAFPDRHNDAAPGTLGCAVVVVVPLHTQFIIGKHEPAEYTYPTSHLNLHSVVLQITLYTPTVVGTHALPFHV
jgi:hypothetical protein